MGSKLGFIYFDPEMSIHKRNPCLELVGWIPPHNWTLVNFADLHLYYVYVCHIGSTVVEFIIIYNLL